MFWLLVNTGKFSFALNKKVFLKRFFFLNIRKRKPTPTKIYRKPLMLVSLFNNVTGSQAYKFIKNRHQYQCFPANLVYFLRAPPGNCFLKESSFYLLKHLVEGNLISKLSQGILYFSTHFHHNLSILELYTLNKK